MIGQVTPIAVTARGWKYYIVFIVCNLTNAIFFWAFQPESKGLNLEDMDELFREHPTFVPGSKWTPSSKIDENAREIAKQERGVGTHAKHLEDAMKHVEQLS
jgi:hypothetical protein